METQTPSAAPASGQHPMSPNQKLVMWLVIAVIPVGILVYAFANRPTGTPASSTAPVATSAYKDGTYSAVGNYVSPGGAEEVNVSLTLKNGIIADSTFTANSPRPMSARFQGQFASGYKSLVVGKPIADLKLGAVSGSSLTPMGFNDAVAKIQAQAKS